MPIPDVDAGTMAHLMSLDVDDAPYAAAAIMSAVVAYLIAHGGSELAADILREWAAEIEIERPSGHA